MKRITALLLVFVLFFSIGIITSCSGESKKSSAVKTSKTKSETVKEEKFDSDKALDAVLAYLDKEYKEYDEEKLNYKMIPSTDGNVYFVRISLDEIDDDLLVFNNGKVLSKSSDEQEFKNNKDRFPVNIMKITDKEIINRPDCVSGGYGSDFDV